MRHILYNPKDEQQHKALGLELRALKEGEYLITIKKNRTIRSLSANAYYHVVLNYIAVHTNLGYTHDTLHDVCKQMFNYEVVEFPKKGGILRGRSTSDLNTEEFATYIKKVKVWALDEFGIIIPEPQDVDYKKWMELENAYSKQFNGI